MNHTLTNTIKFEIRLSARAQMIPRFQGLKLDGRPAAWHFVCRRPTVKSFVPFRLHNHQQYPFVNVFAILIQGPQSLRGLPVVKIAVSRVHFKPDQVRSVTVF